jgi:cytochrome oxidase assembly protein ShyY1
MVPMSAVAATGCSWQWKKYKASTIRWAIIDREMDTFTPTPIEESFPWETSAQAAADWQYRLVQVTGKLESDKENCFLVRRMADARMGAMVIAPFYTDIPGSPSDLP